VSFASCDGGWCDGTFEFSADEGNPIAVNLFWTQRNQLTGSIDEGALPLGNGHGDLGSVEALVGEIIIDEDGQYGTLRLVGSGADALGGDFAEVSFELEGDVAPI
jgi:hypothetical protein